LGDSIRVTERFSAYLVAWKNIENIALAPAFFIRFFKDLHRFFKDFQGTLGRHFRLD